MYNNIISPNSKKNININSFKGKKILNNYSEFIGGNKYNISNNKYNIEYNYYINFKKNISISGDSI